MALGRAALESVMAHIAANRLSDADIAAMAQLIDDMEHATDHSALEDLVTLNEAYHGAIHRISGCTYLERRLDGQRMYDHAQRIALLAESGRAPPRLRGTSNRFLRRCRPRSRRSPNKGCAATSSARRKPMCGRCSAPMRRDWPMTNDKVRTALRGISGVHVTAWGADGEADWA
jgi:hypothetical protein